ncbi:MAG TPA: ABC transporter permease, partial [Methylomirabilota bacterium]|nr:ABC transporter permease [Methylomirabilota bacterium]
MTAAPAAAARRHGAGWTAAALLGPASVVVTLGILLPIVILFRYSLNRFTPARVMVDAVTAENYVKFVTDPFYLGVLARTLRVATVCTALCLGLG